MSLPADGDPVGLLVADVFASLALLAVAAVADRRRLAAVSGLAAVAWVAGGLAGGLALVHRPLLAHAALGFPSGRLGTRRARVAVGCLWLVAMAAPIGRSAAADLIGAVLVLVAAGGGWATARRARWITRGAAACVALGLGGAAVARLLQPAGAAAVPVATGYALLVAAAALLLAGGLATGAGGVSDTADTIVELADLRGADVADLLGTERAAVAVGVRGGVDDDADRAAGIARGLVADHVARQDSLRRQVHQVRDARRRDVEVADVERRRLRDLLAASTDEPLGELDALLRGLAGSGEAGRQGERLVAEVALLRTEIDRLGRGLHPGLLERGGLRAGLDELGRSSPLRTVIDAPDRRFAGSVETTLWYVCCEAIANAAKHAGATTIHVVLEVHADEVVATVSDDGSGGAQPAPGGGLVGLADRLGAVGGSLHVADGADVGTVVRARVPIGGGG